MNPLRKNELMELSNEEMKATAGGMALLVPAVSKVREAATDDHKIDLSVCDLATFDHDKCLG